MKKLVKFILILAILSSCSTPPKTTEINSKNLDSELDNLVIQIAKSFSENQKRDIAVIEFSNIDRITNNLGKYIAEELTTRLYKSGKFYVVERQLLNKILQEQEMSLTGMIDENSAVRLGYLLGVQAIATGTITDLGYSVKVNARLISTESGRVFSVASVEVPKDDTVRKLMNRVSSAEINKIDKPEDSTLTKEVEEKTIERNVIESKKTFFMENFSKIDEGFVPEGWMGCEHLMVRTESRSGRKYLTPFEEGSKRISIPKIDFPNNFRINITGKFQRRYNTEKNIIISMGNLKIIVGTRSVSLGNAEGPGAESTITDIAIVKQGPLFKLYIDGGQKLIARYPNFTQPTSLIIDFSHSSVDFELYEIRGINLDE